MKISLPALFSAAFFFAPWALADERLAPTHADVPYDEHERTKIDFWKAEGEGPRPLLVYIHGGGWTGGDKSKSGPAYEVFLEKGISCAAVNYRLAPDDPLPAPVHDAARAIQFLRYKADEWNIRADRIVLTGGSAGACTSMWILCHDDLADPDSTDPVARESTRVQGAFVSGGQTSIDPPQIEKWLGPMVLQHRMVNLAVGERTIEDAIANYDEHEKIYKEFSAYNHVSEDDPPLLMTYGSRYDPTVEKRGTRHSPSRLRREDEGEVRQNRAGVPLADPGGIRITKICQRQRVRFRHSPRRESAVGYDSTGLGG
ncbi:MAG: alpha/beta hydrolase [Verrucomicrobiales bacterium]